MTPEELRKTVIAQAQGAMALNIAFIGISNGLLDHLNTCGHASVDELAASAHVDAGYVRRWCEAAYAFGYLEEQQGKFTLTEVGRAFMPGAPGSLMPFAVQSILGAHVAERAAGLMPSGERPGEQVLAERKTILPWYGPMMEANFSAFFEREVLPAVKAYEDVGSRGGTVVDLGCGTGWYLRRLASRFPELRGIGLDGFAENVRHADALSQAAGLGSRLTFQTGDIHRYTVNEPVDLVAMNRSLHHVWDRKDSVFQALSNALKPDGHAVIWEPAWPAEIAALREPRRRGMAVQNLSEHVQGNHFLMPGEIEAAFHAVGMQTQTFLFAEGTEAIVVGSR
jgi:SAM-dependent methyltransferase